MTINIDKEVELAFPFDQDAYVEKVILAAMDFVDCPYEAEVNVLFTDNEGIHEMNKEYREIDRPTDVLSFPMVEYEIPGNFDSLEEQGDCFHPETGELLLGDIVLSYDKIKEQAVEFGHSELRELCFLVAHSMLHLFGYDHMEEEERAEMEQMQRDILTGLNILR
ncbi:MAG: rRNA maturation RNase YbeY [Lachnospiraceae bacterium]|nr:rRNA maturation RNase YbeY [Lachnospiraceae bacterium]MBQ8190104.1 rRNA maturation RNase YbeY [Lachnospiraceae bacterium]